MGITIKVTAEIIEASKKLIVSCKPFDYCELCPVNLAARIVLEDVEYTTVRDIVTKTKEYKLPEFVGERIKKFDKTLDMEPFEFTL